uniref:Uncharacterized protein n=1 Tax=Rhizophora mucronata TaxID=61149 RepID=A0A2P2NZR8_RHIMU
MKDVTWILKTIALLSILIPHAICHEQDQECRFTKNSIFYQKENQFVWCFRQKLPFHFPSTRSSRYQDRDL